MHAAKQLLRKQTRTALRALTESERALQSADVCARVAAHPRFGAAHNVSIFISMPHEVQTRALLECALLSAKRVFVPRVVGAEDMVMVQISSLDEIDAFPRSPLGVSEPPLESLAARAHALEQLDLIVVPGVAFDAQHRRLGQGRGFYDRFAKQCGAHVFLLGVGLSPQRCDSVPCDAHDVSMHDTIIASPTAAASTVR